MARNGGQPLENSQPGDEALSPTGAKSRQQTRELGSGPWSAEPSDETSALACTLTAVW